MKTRIVNLTRNAKKTRGKKDNEDSNGPRKQAYQNSGQRRQNRRQLKTRVVKFTEEEKKDRFKFRQ